MRDRMGFSFTEHDESDGSVRVRAVGELDASEAPDFQETLRRLESEGRDVLLDLSGLEFMDLLGLHVIQEAADAARHGGFGFAISGPVPMAVRRMFVEVGAEHHLPGHQAQLARPPSAPEPHADIVAASATDSDQTLSDRDQTSSDQDQTWSDRDQEDSDANQRASDRDQEAADRDQRAADREQGDSGGHRPARDAGYETSRRSRRDTTHEREETADERAGTGESRDRTATQRDATAAERDAAAAQRDLAAYGRDRIADVGDRSSSAAQIARRARHDRQRAQTNREQATSDREQAARDRAHAARDRNEASDDREPPPHDPATAVDGA